MSLISKTIDKEYTIYGQETPLANAGFFSWATFLVLIFMMFKKHDLNYLMFGWISAMVVGVVVYFISKKLIEKYKVK